MTVEETIEVNAAGRQIRRGIYRDFPTRYRDRLNHRVVISFDVLGATRDGKPEKYKVESRMNGVRVYLGSEDVLLSPGRYRYVLRYRVNRQIGFFQGFDEIYWNVTGNDWAFPIDEATATVILPEPVAEEAWRLAAYTGPAGSNGKAYLANVTGPRTVTFQSTRVLPPYHGITIAAGFPKGIVDPPSAVQKAGYFLRDNAGVLVALFGLLGVVGYYVSVWRRFGRDPRPGIIIPRYEPPAGYSPASLRFLWHMKYDATCLAAALVNLAVHEKLSIHQKDKWFSKRFSVKRIDSHAEDMHSGEKSVFTTLFRSRRELPFDDKHHATIKRALTRQERALRDEYEGKLFVRNGRYVRVAAIASILTGAATLVLGGIANAFAGGTSALGITLIGLLFVVNWAFARWMKAPTAEGREILDQIEGLKLYLGVAERQDLELAQEPPQTFDEFERLLPYAVALDCASTWVDRFEETLESLERAGELQSRGWYAGGDVISARGITSSVDGIASNLGSSISSSSTPPGSSSGSGGGGFSGGGGGGGGGGGW